MLIKKKLRVVSFSERLGGRGLGQEEGIGNWRTREINLVQG